MSLSKLIHLFVFLQFLVFWYQNESVCFALKCRRLSATIQSHRKMPIESARWHEAILIFLHQKGMSFSLTAPFRKNLFAFAVLWCWKWDTNVFFCYVVWVFIKNHTQCVRRLVNTNGLTYSVEVTCVSDTCRRRSAITI